MSQPYVGEIRIFAGNFAPAGWMFYGGHGQSTFALPNLQGRAPMHMGGGNVLATPGGVETVTLTTSQIPVHNHALLGAGANGNAQHPSNTTLGDGTGGLTQYHAGPG